MNSADLFYDPNEIGSDCVVCCRISNGPRHDDPGFDPAVGDRVILVDGDGEVLSGLVTASDRVLVWVQVDLASPHAVSA